MDHTRCIRYNRTDAPIAQLDRAPDFESVGRGFESLWARSVRNDLGEPVGLP